MFCVLYKTDDEFLAKYTDQAVPQESLVATSVTREKRMASPRVGAAPTSWDWRNATPSILNNIKTRALTCPASWGDLENFIFDKYFLAAY